jgi:hypothetical protein
MQMKHKTKTNLLVDILIFIVFLTVYEEKATGTAIHEWLGIALGFIFIVHIILHWKWLVVNTTLFLHRMRTESRINYVLDILIFIGFTTIIFSGIMISESVLPAFGIKALRNHSWQEIHFVSVDITLFLTALHFALHWRWIADNFKRYIIGPLKSKAHKNMIPEQVIVRTSKAPSAYFSSFAKVSFQVFVILALSGMISFGWYAASGRFSEEPKSLEITQRRERTREARLSVESERRPGRHANEHRGRHGEKGHHNESGIFGGALLKNLLIFAIITLVITRFRAIIKGKKEVKVPLVS